MSGTYVESGRLRDLVRIAFPNYKGRKPIRVEIFPEGGMSLNSYWDSGNRDYYAIMDLQTLRAVTLPQNGTMFDGKNYRAAALPVDVCIVQHAYAGNHQYITIFVRPENMPQALPAPNALTDDEKVVLKYTRGLKPCYAGISNYRFHAARRETGITTDRWEAAKASLQANGFLNAAGAITVRGRNAVS